MPRLRDVPASLRERILEAVPPASHVGLADALKAAGDRLLASARSGPPTRETALTLLAADALMTFACEAMAEHDRP